MRDSIAEIARPSGQVTNIYIHIYIYIYTLEACES